MKPLQAPRTWMVYAGLGTLLWLTLAFVDWSSGNVTWRITAYLVLAVASIYMFFRALITLRSGSTPHP